MANEWFYKQDGTEHGPISSRELKSLAARGMLDASDQVSLGRSRWLAAGKLTGLFPGDATASSDPPSADESDSPTPIEPILGVGATDEHVQQATEELVPAGETLLAMVRGRVESAEERPTGSEETPASSRAGKGFLGHYLIATDQRVILWARGVLRSSCETFLFDDINSVEHQASALAQGAVVVSVLGKTARFAGMHETEARQVADLLRERIHEQRNRRTIDHDDRITPFSKIEGLARLMEKGRITREEYEDQKRKLLDQL